MSKQKSGEQLLRMLCAIPATPLFVDEHKSFRIVAFLTAKVAVRSNVRILNKMSKKKL